MPQDTTEQPTTQAPTGDMQGNPEESMLIGMLQELDQKVEELSQRMDAIEQGTPSDPQDDAVNMQQLTQNVAQGVETMNKGMQDLTAAVKQIGPAKSKLRERLKGKVYGNK